MQQYPYPAYRQAPPRPVITEEYVRRCEQKKLRKQSNGLGFLILTYYSTLQIFAIVLVLFYRFTGIDVTGNHVAEYLLDIAASVFASLIPALVYLFASGFKLRDSFGKTHVRPMKLIPVLLIGMGLSMVANGAADMFIKNISLFGLENHAGSIQMDALSPFEIILSVIAIAVVPAFAEEFVFRGIVMGSLKKYGRAFAVVVSSIMFGAMHSNTTQIVFAFLLGLAFGFVDIVTDSILPSVIIHFINNFYATMMKLLTKNNILDQYTTYTIYFAITALFCVGGILAFIYLIKTDKEMFRLTDKEKPLKPYAETLSLKDKYHAFFINAGMIISCSVFLLMTIANLLPVSE